MPLGSHRRPRAHAREPRTELPAASPGQPQHRRALTSMFPPTLASRGGSGLSRSLFSCRRDCLLPPTAKQPSVGRAPAARTDGQSSLCSPMGAGPGRAAESPHRPTAPAGTRSALGRQGTLLLLLLRPRPSPQDLQWPVKQQPAACAAREPPHLQARGDRDTECASPSNPDVPAAPERQGFPQSKIPGSKRINSL